MVGGYRKVAADTNVFIYALEGEDTFQAAKDLFTGIGQSGAALVTSTITLLEMAVSPYSLGRDGEIDRITRFIQADGRCQVLPVTESIAKRAALIRGRGLANKVNLKVADAIQIATALEAKADVFVTADPVCAKQASLYLPVEIIRAA